MAKNNVSFFKKITFDQIASLIQTEDHIQLKYYEADEEHIIPIDQDESGIIELNVSGSIFLPSEHELLLSQTFLIGDLSSLFGINGVTHQDNSIGFAAQIQSSDSDFTRTVTFEEFTYPTNPNKACFNYRFKKGELRGSVHVRFFLYLKKLWTNGKFQAKLPGTILSEGYFNELDIIIDGEGSLFPITEFEKKDGPLWELIMNWDEASINTFDTNHIEIRLNKSHKLYPKLSDTYGLLNRGMMDSILIESIGSIMYQVFSEDVSLAIEDIKDYPENSIATVVSNWASEYDIYPDDKLQTIFNKLRLNIDHTKSEVNAND